MTYILLLILYDLQSDETSLQLTGVITGSVNVSYLKFHSSSDLSRLNCSTMAFIKVICWS